METAANDINRIRIYIGHTVSKLLDLNQITVMYRQGNNIVYQKFFSLDEVADATKLFEDLCLQVEINITQEKLKQNKAL